MSAYDVAVIGAGAAGLAAALSAARAGARILLLDDGPEPGGSLLLSPDLSAGADLYGDDMAGPDLARRLASDASQADVNLRTSTTTWGLFPGSVFTLATTGGDVRARVVVAATGAVDAPLPFPGWTEPGVITERAARDILRERGTLSGWRVLIVGSTPDAVELAAALTAAGSLVMPLVEAWPQPLASDDAIGRAPIPLHTGTTVTGVFPREGQVEVSLSTGTGIDHHFVDAVIVAGGAMAESTLPRLGGASLRYEPLWGTPVVVHDETMRAAPLLCVAGRVCGALSPHAALAQGMLAGLHAAATALGRAPGGDAARWRRRADAAQKAARSRYRQGLNYGHPLLRFLPGDSSRDEIVACRCEGLSVAEVAAAIAAGSHSQDAVKRRTRAGMGICQGRSCGAVVSGLIAQGLGLDPASLDWMTPRAPARPISMSDLVVPFTAFDRLDS